jgi:uncharacterized protein (TIGR02186 family)
VTGFLRSLILICSLLAFPSFAYAAEPRLVPDVSQREVDIQSRFTGEELLLFGAILYPKGVVPSGEVDIAVVLRGQTRPILVREKQKVAGIWVNADSIDFRSAPTYYAIASSRPLEKLIDEKTAAIYELGLSRLQLSPSGELTNSEVKRFTAGLVGLNNQDGLYVEKPGTVNITGQVLYRARLYLPSSVPEGRYTAETLLIRNGKVIAADDSVVVTVRKTGFERFITILAEDYSLIYGMLAVFISVLLGWAAGVGYGRLR